MPMRRFDNADDRPPEDLTAWLAAGVRRVEAMAWRRWNYTLDEATRWRTAGVTEALAAAQWQAAGVTPATVRGWMDAKIGATAAIRWHEFGYDLAQATEHARRGMSPEQVYQQRNQTQTHQVSSSSSSGGMAAGLPIHQGIQRFLQSGAPHQLMHGYVEAQWFDDEAIGWAKEGIPASHARDWQLIGLTAVEAGELQKPDQTPMSVVRDWVRAGIPFDEVADWLGAGLTVQEAVAQRASGVTVEQAAALRALRRGGAL